MKPLQKAILTAHADNQNWRKELHSFLLNYRASLHSTTKIPPAETLYNRPIGTKLSEPITKPLNTARHKKLKVADVKVQRKMKDMINVLMLNNGHSILEILFQSNSKRKTSCPQDSTAIFTP